MRIMLRGKIHRARVTEANLNYEGSITIDETLMEAADILPYERVQVLDLDNGSRIETYAIVGDRDSGVICINGAAARLFHVGDKVIILGYSIVADEEAKHIKPKLINVDERNAIVSKDKVMVP